MFNRQTLAAWDLELPSLLKLLLLALARRACVDCALSWPAVSRLMKETGSSHGTVVANLRRLESGGHLRRFAYGQGGRGASTVYVVLPQLEDLVPPPCPRCQENLARMGKPEAAATVVPEPIPSSTRRVSATGKPSSTRRVSGQYPPNHDANTVQTGFSDSRVQATVSQVTAALSAPPATGHHQPLYRTASARMRAREAEAPPAPRQSHPPEAPQPGPATVGEGLRQLGLRNILPELDTIALPKTSAATPPDKDEAQGPCPSNSEGGAGS